MNFKFMWTTFANYIELCITDKNDLVIQKVGYIEQILNKHGNLIEYVACSKKELFDELSTLYFHTTYINEAKEFVKINAVKCLEQLLQNLKELSV